MYEVESMIKQLIYLDIYICPVLPYEKKKKLYRCFSFFIVINGI